MAVTGSRTGLDDVIVLANVRNQAGVLAEMQSIAAGTSRQRPMRVLSDFAQLATLGANQQGPIAYVGGSVLVFATSSQSIRDAIAAQQSSKSGFAGRPFYTSIAQAYSKGAGTLF